MKPIFKTCTPRDDILQGELREDIFAARLRDVIEGNADDIYRDPELFFENTHPTDGLKTLLRESLGRLTGSAPGKNALIRLETSFGGGKTHALIALYHLASGHAPMKADLSWLGKDIEFPKEGAVRVAGVVGSDLDANVGLLHEPHKIRTKTLWGEIAYQLGGAEGYKAVETAAESFAAPGAAFMEELERLEAGPSPALVMIDEIARYLRMASAVPTETGKGTLGDQTIAFLMSLIEYAASRPYVVVVLTLAGGSDAFAPETELLQQQLAEAKAVSARQERVIHPSDEREMPAIVVHRLFKAIDKKSAKSALDRYAAYYHQLYEKGAELPEKANRPEFHEEFERSYPFHPDLLITLDRKVSTIPNFHRTRGALRLLARTVRNLWENQPEGVYAIHPYHLNLADPQISEDLTSRLDRPKFNEVIDADIVSELKGSAAHSEEVDRDYPAPYARRLSTTIFLHSLAQTGQTGARLSELNLAVLTPAAEGGDDQAVLGRALERLYDTAWFLEYDGHRYRFKTEPSLNKIVHEEMNGIGRSRGKVEVEERIRKIWRKGFFDVKCFPDTPAQVPNDAGPPKLVIVHFDAANAEAGSPGPPDLLRRLFKYKGANESFRDYQNNLVFLVADEGQIHHMVDVCRRYLATKRILEDRDRQSTFNEEQIKKLTQMREGAELEARVAITRAYRYLYYPTADAPKGRDHLRRETLPAQDQGEVEQDQTNVILRILRSLNKVQTADDAMLSAAYAKSKAWDVKQVSMSTEDLRRAFARKVGLRMLLDLNQLKKTIRNGVETGVWLYYDSQEEFAYSKESPPPAYRIGEETLLYTPEEADRLGLRVKGIWQPREAGQESSRCPVCGRPEDECICGADVPKKGRPGKLDATGSPLKAFKDIADQAAEHEIVAFERLFLSVDAYGLGAAGDLRALALAVPQLGKADFAMDVDLILEFVSERGREEFHLAYRGGWDRYKRLGAIIDEFTKDAESANVKARLSAGFDSPLAVGEDRYQSLAKVFSDLEIDHLRIEAVPAEGEEALK